MVDRKRFTDNYNYRWFLFDILRDLLILANISYFIRLHYSLMCAI